MVFDVGKCVIWNLSGALPTKCTSCGSQITLEREVTRRVSSQQETANGTNADEDRYGEVLNVCATRKKCTTK
jgi:hypothetical protein